MSFALVRRHWLLILTIALYLWGFSVTPERTARALEHAALLFLSVIMLILAVFCLVGLLQVWISRDQIVRLLGRDSGIKGLLIAALCGTLLIGPAYIIFPLLMELRQRGARWAVVAIVLTSYAVKLQMIPIEVEFLGWPFAFGRLLIIVAMAVPIGLLLEALMEKTARPL